ncbi:MAG TPA: hypothetical protein VH500_19015 [Nitrososphaeraceae archaeon]
MTLVVHQAIQMYSVPDITTDITINGIHTAADRQNRKFIIPHSGKGRENTKARVPRTNRGFS